MGSLEDEVRKLQDAQSRAAAEEAARRARDHGRTDPLAAEFIALMKKHHVPTVPLFVEDSDIEFSKGTKWRPDVRRFRFTYLAEMWILHFPGDRNTPPADRAIRCDAGRIGTPAAVAIPSEVAGCHYHHPPGAKGYQGGRQIERRNVTRVELDARAQSYAARYDNHLWVTKRHLLNGPHSAPNSDHGRDEHLKSLAQMSTRLLSAGRCTPANHRLRR
ncbi:hypothetical protein ACIGO9_19625 [Nocardia asteroides]|uniref:hypothetical protein n=1 Tax=Nocardia asteroides TaxID=1824 RepID=UPI0037C753F7